MTYFNEDTILIGKIATWFRLVIIYACIGLLIYTCITSQNNKKMIKKQVDLQTLKQRIDDLEELISRDVKENKVEDTWYG